MNLVDLVRARFENDPEAFHLVEVLWSDAVASDLDAWVHGGEILNEPAPSCSIGYLLAWSDVAITLASLVNVEAVGAAVTIPMGCVHEIRYLTPIPFVEDSNSEEEPDETSTIPTGVPLMNVTDLFEQTDPIAPDESAVEQGDTEFA